jgi:hypothetical protein
MATVQHDTTAPTVTVRVPKRWLAALAVANLAGVVTTALALGQPGTRETVALARVLVAEAGLWSGLVVTAGMKLAGAVFAAELAGWVGRTLVGVPGVRAWFPAVLRSGCYAFSFAYFGVLAGWNVAVLLGVV